MIAVTSLDDFSMHIDAVGSWPFVAVVAAVLGVVLFAVGPDRSRVSGARVTTLVLLRLLVFVAIVICLLRPTFVSTKKARQQATVILLADASESMSVADGPNGRTRWQELQAALSAATPAANALVADGNFTIAAWRFDREMQSVTAQPEDPFPLGSWKSLATSDETAIGAAIDDSTRASAGKNLAGIIVLSDGAQHAYSPRDLPPQAAARKLGDMAVPLWSITFGQQRAAGQGRDASIINLSVGETVYLKNSLEISGRVRLDGLADRQAVVKLLAENDSGGMDEVARTTVRGSPQGLEESVQLAWTPQSLGERKLSLLVETQEGEVVVTNNELSTFVEVIDGGLRVLYLEGALRVEQRFLRRVLSASPDMQVDFQWIDSSKRAKWPLDLSRTLASNYNVFLIGDLDSSSLEGADLQAIVAKVQAGSGIGLLGGFHSFEAGGWGSSALAPLLPFETDRLARQAFGEPIREGLHLRGPLKVVPDRRFGGVSILRLGKTDQETQAAWQALSPLDGANDLGRLALSAKPLAVSAEGQPLLVAREFGGGRVLAFAPDSTWKWVMQGAGEQHRRFWRQMVLWLARQDDQEKDSLWVRLSQRRLSPGTLLEFDSGLTNPDGTALVNVGMEAVVISPSGQSRPVRLAQKGETFSGLLTDCADPGDWKLIVKATRPQSNERLEKSARFTVFRQDLELANPRANPLLMRQLAEATPGAVRSPEELADIFAEIGQKPAGFETLEQWSYTPWDKWPMFLLLAACLCSEWFLRKRWGLV